MTKKIVLFASGSGSNVENIIRYFQTKETVKTTHVFCNNIRAKVLNRANNLGVTALHFDRESFYNTPEVLHLLQDANPDLIVLAGFLWKMPVPIIQAFENKIINIHPALLPKFGGKGMYGMNVHKAVVAAQETASGMTIHYVNENYDEGKIIFQAKTPVTPQMDAQQVADAVLELEHKHYPQVIEKVLYGKNL